MNDLKKKVGQAFCPAAFIHDTPEGIAQIERYIREFEIGGLTFFYSRQSVETNFDRKTYTREKDSVAQLARMVDRYQQVSKEPLLISIDAEWGLGMRIDSHPPFPYPMTLGATETPDVAFDVGRAIALELKALGIHFNLAPVGDINVNPRNPVIGYRSFGESPEKVFQWAWAYYQGMKSEGLLGCVKHFPGHGDTHVDSHLGLPVIDKSRSELDANELYPFRKFIDQGVDCVMVGHMMVPAIDPENPTSLSARCVEGVLRDDLSFSGPVMTDALNMRSVFADVAPGEIPFRAFSAGNDILSFTPDLEEGIEQILKQADPFKIETSYQRVTALKYKAGIFEGLRPQFSVPDNSALKSDLAHDTVTVLKGISSPISEGEPIFSWFQSPGSKFNEGNRLTIVDGADFERLRTTLANHRKLWIIVIPPSQKPGNQFGMAGELLNLLNETIASHEVHLAWIGNAYGLQYCDWSACESVVLGYQNLPEMEREILSYWLGKSIPRGKLNVTIP